MQMRHTHTCKCAMHTHAKVPCTQMQMCHTHTCKCAMHTHANVPCTHMQICHAHTCKCAMHTHANVPCTHMRPCRYVLVRMLMRTYTCSTQTCACSCGRWNAGWTKPHAAQIVIEGKPHAAQIVIEGLLGAHLPCPAASKHSAAVRSGACMHVRACVHACIHV